MEFLFNDCSIHGQFPTPGDFHIAVDNVMSIRQEIQRFGRDLACHKCLRYAAVTQNHSMEQAIQRMDPNKKKGWIQWLTNIQPTRERKSSVLGMGKLMYQMGFHRYEFTSIGQLMHLALFSYPTLVRRLLATNEHASNLTSQD